MNWLVSVILAAAVLAAGGSVAKSDASKEVKTEKNKPVILGNFLSAPNNCESKPGPIPVPILQRKPSNGFVGLQIVVADVAATDSCPARKIPAIALFYSPNGDFSGTDSVQIDIETPDKRIATQSFLIKVEPTETK